jgi:hypothetical protein
MNAIRVETPRFGHGEQQQVELLERIGQPRQKIIRFPARMRRQAGFTMRLLVSTRKVRRTSGGSSPRWTGIGTSSRCLRAYPNSAVDW